MTVDALASHFGMSREKMVGLLEKHGVDLTDAPALLMFISDLSHELCLNSGREVLGDED